MAHKQIRDQTAIVANDRIRVKIIASDGVDQFAT